MNLLLDSHALIWFLEDDERLSGEARAAVSDPANLCFVSDATLGNWGSSRLWENWTCRCLSKLCFLIGWKN